MAVALRTARLLLRELRDDDREPFAAISADPMIVVWLPGQADRAASDVWIDRMRRHHAEYGFGYWAVEVPGEASVIGRDRALVSAQPAVCPGGRNRLAAGSRLLAPGLRDRGGARRDR